MKTYKSKYNAPEYRIRYTGIYSSWYAMKQRCGNPNNKQFADYGGRGITFPEAWKKFSGFSADMKESYKKGLSLDRIDNSLGYSKSNCKWSTRKEQNNNKRSNIVLTFKGVTLPIALWAEKIGLDFGTVRSRWYQGLPVEQILESRKMPPFGFLKI